MQIVSEENAVTSSNVPFSPFNWILGVSFFLTPSVPSKPNLVKQRNAFLNLGVRDMIQKFQDEWFRCFQVIHGIELPKQKTIWKLNQNLICLEKAKSSNAYTHSV